MNAKFIDKVIREGFVDTKNYRYVCRVDKTSAVVSRLPINRLDTTAALEPWEVVEVIAESDE